MMLQIINSEIHMPYGGNDWLELTKEEILKCEKNHELSLNIKNSEVPIPDSKT